VFLIIIGLAHSLPVYYKRAGFKKIKSKEVTMRKQFVWIIAIAILIAGAGYYFATKGKNRATSLDVAGRQSGHPSVEAPDFVLNGPDGRKISLSDFEGQAVVINFFATWCPPCKSEIPGFVRVYNRYKDRGLEIIGISLDNDAEKVLPGFIRENGITYTVAIGNRNVMSMYGGVQTIPTTFFVNRKGQITNVHIGFLDEKGLEEEVKKII
jgi:cytochrome c biogenesis protein CcmG/thiol:disulfide interchange protein DsbE